MTAWEVFFLFQQLGADCCLSLMLTVFIGLAWSLCFTQPSGSGSWDQLCFFKEDGLMLQTFFLSICKSLVFSEISLTDLCLEGLFVDVCERLYLRFRFGCLFQFFYFHLQSCRRKLNFSREGFFHTVMYSSAQNDDAKLAIRGQTSADSKWFFFWGSHPYSWEPVLLSCAKCKKGMNVWFFPEGNTSWKNAGFSQ